MTKSPMQTKPSSRIPATDLDTHALTPLDIISQLTSNRRTSRTTPLPPRPNTLNASTPTKKEITESPPKAGCIARVNAKTSHTIRAAHCILDAAAITKELVENALDAQATRIEIRLRGKAALDSITVSDNGVGIASPDHSTLCQPSTTSKLCAMDDLTTLHTFGFRGEALSAIRSVCASLTVLTKTREDTTAKSLTFDSDGSVINTSIAARPVGTTVSVTKVFHALPVRKKDAVKNSAREVSRCVAVVQALAIISTHARLELRIASDVKVSSIPHERDVDMSKTRSVSLLALRATAKSVLGTRATSALEEVKEEEMATVTIPPPFRTPSSEDDSQPLQTKATYSCKALVSSAQLDADGSGGRARSLHQYVYINERPVDLPRLTRAANEVYRRATGFSAASPTLIINLSLPAWSCDINLAPNKRHVLIHDEDVLVSGFIRMMERVWMPTTAAPIPVQRTQTTILSAFARKSHSRHESPDDADDCSNQTRSQSKSQVSPPPIPTEDNPQTPQEKSMADYLQSAEGCPVIDNSDESQDDDIVDEQLNPRNMVARADIEQWQMSGAGFEGQHKGLSEDTAQPDTPHMHPANIISSPHQELAHIPDMPPSPSIDNEVEALSVQPEVVPNPINGRYNVDNEVALLTPKNDGTDDLTAMQIDKFDARTALNTTRRGKRVRDFVERHAKRVSARREGDCDCTPLSARGPGSENVVRQIIVDGPSAENFSRKSGHVPVMNVDWDAVCDSMGEACKKRDDLATRKDGIAPKCAEFEKASVDTAVESATGGNGQEAADRELSRLFRQEWFKELRVIGQFNRGFIIAQLKKDLFIIDQHASDEKYNFENLQATTTITKQKLVHPQQLEFSTQDELLISQHLPALRAGGFDLRFNAENPPTRRLSLLAQPVSKRTMFVEKDLEDIVHALRTGVFAVGVSVLRPPRVRAMFATRACRMSIMIGTALHVGEMQRVLSRLGDIEHPWTCPHGRPTMRHLCTMSD